MNAILDVLFQITFYSAILFGAVLLFKRIFKKHLSAAMGFALWLILIARLLVPVTWDSGFSLITYPAAPPLQTQPVFADSNPQFTQTYQNSAVPAASAAPASLDPQNVHDLGTEYVLLPASMNGGLDWQTAVVLVWIAGACISGGYFTWIMRKMGKNIRKNGTPPPPEIAKFVEQCSSELGIGARLHTVLLPGIASPALTASLRPKLLLPDTIAEDMDAQQLAFAVRHELTHYKRRDHLMSLLLVVLRCVYWFNPVVWAAFRMIHIDMEAACDARMTENLEREKKLNYINTMIDMGGVPKSQYMLGMGIRWGKKAMEQRIRGIYMRKKTGTPVLAMALAAALILVLVCFTTACQPVPASSTAISQDLQKLVAQATARQDGAGSLKERLNVPDTFKADAQSTDGRFKAKADANIVLPDAGSIPITRVEGEPFDRQTLEKIKNALMTEGKFYDPETLAQNTKTELNNVLTLLLQRKAELEQQGLAPLHPEIANGTEPTPGSTPTDGTASMMAYNQLDMVNQDIATIQNNLGSALDQRKLVEVPGDLQPAPVTDGLSGEERQAYEQNPPVRLNAAQLNPGGGMRTLNIYSSGKMSQLYYANRGDYDSSYGFYFTEDSWNQNQKDGNKMADSDAAASLKYPGISADQAKKTADGFLKQVGLQGYACERCEKMIGGSGQSWGNYVRKGKLLKAYVLQYVRQVGGVPITYTDVPNAIGSKDGPANGLDTLWYYERLTFVIDDSGIVEFQWDAPYHVLDTLVANASMLPFPQIEDIFKKNIVTVYTGWDVVEMDMNVNEVRLGLARVTEKGAKNEGALIPVWDFFGTFTQYTDQDGKRYTDPFVGTGDSLLTINAIDGSIIDRQYASISGS